MRTINPYLAAANRSPDLFKARAMQARALSDEEIYHRHLTSLHRFELHSGAESTGQFETMTGLQARLFNKDFIREFSDEVGRVFPARPQTKMQRWVLVEQCEGEGGAE